MDPVLRELLYEEVNDEIEAIIRTEKVNAEIPGVRMVARFGHIATCRLRRKDISKIRYSNGVKSLKAARSLVADNEVQLEQENQFLKFINTPVNSDLRRSPDIALTGAGTIVGVIDWGCDIAADAIRNEDGTSRLIALWNQRDSKEDHQDNFYGYGTIYTQQEINEALLDSNPYDALNYHPADADAAMTGSHGMHVIDIAAGNGRGGGPLGIAPKAKLIFVHLADKGTGGLANLGDSVRILEAIDFIRKMAGNTPCVINCSVGRHAGPHDGTMGTDLAIDYLLNNIPGFFIVQSAGNYSNKKIHSSGRLEKDKEHVLRVFVDEADVTPNELEIWYSGKDRFVVKTESPNGNQSAWTHLGDQSDIVEDNKLIGRIYNRACDPNNHDNHIDIFLYPEAQSGWWLVTIKGAEVANGNFHAWLERDGACPGCQSRFSEEDSDDYYTTGTLANGHSALVVGACDAHANDKSIAWFSSRGPTRDNRNKPDLVAPGVNVLAARSTPRDGFNNSEKLVRKSGTSMAAPHVTGAVALCLQAMGRNINGREIRNLILNNVDPVSWPEISEFNIGCGYLNLKKTVDAAVKKKMKYRKSFLKRLNEYEDQEENDMRQNNSEIFDEFYTGANKDISLVDSEKKFLAEIMHQSDKEGISRLPSPDELYSEIVYEQSTPFSRLLNDNFMVVARPGESLVSTAMPDDILLRVGLGESGLGHVARISNPKMWSHENIQGSSITPESSLPGYYVEVLERDSYRYARPSRIARRILDPRGRMLPGQLLLRAKAANDYAENEELTDTYIEGESARAYKTTNFLEQRFDVGEDDESNVVEARRYEKQYDQFESFTPMFGPGTGDIFHVINSSSTVSLQTLQRELALQAYEEYLRWRTTSGAVITESYTKGKTILRNDYWPAAGIRNPSAALGANWWSNKPWSAAFISFTINDRANNLGLNNLLSGKPNHMAYTWQAYKDRSSKKVQRYWAYQPDRVMVDVGDIIVKSRGSGSQATWNDVKASKFRFKSTHGDVVVSTSSSEARVIGGNLGNSVNYRKYTLSNGFINTNTSSNGADKVFAVLKLVGSAT